MISGRVPGAGEEHPEDRVEPEAKARPGHPDAVVEPSDETLERRHATVGRGRVLASRLRDGRARRDVVTAHCLRT